MENDQNPSEEQGTWKRWKNNPEGFDEEAHFAANPKHKVFRPPDLSDAEREEIDNFLKDGHELFFGILAPALKQAAHSRGITLYKGTPRERHVFPALDNAKMRAISWIHKRAEIRKMGPNPPQQPSGQ